MDQKTINLFRQLYRESAEKDFIVRAFVACMNAVSDPVHVWGGLYVDRGDIMNALFPDELRKELEDTEDTSGE